MGLEIEVKYLLRENRLDYVKNQILDTYSSLDDLVVDAQTYGQIINQGYLDREKGEQLAGNIGMEVGFNPREFRLRKAGGKFFLTVKGKGGLAREELEREINETNFNLYWPQTEGRRIQKIRLEVPYQGRRVQVDVYRDRDLITAEVEFKSLGEAKEFRMEGLNVTTNPDYKNKNLAK